MNRGRKDPLEGRRVQRKQEMDRKREREREGYNILSPSIKLMAPSAIFG